MESVTTEADLFWDTDELK